jgi:hypothetical protein
MAEGSVGFELKVEGAFGVEVGACAARAGVGVGGAVGVGDERVVGDFGKYTGCVLLASDLLVGGALASAAQAGGVALDIAGEGVSVGSRSVEQGGECVGEESGVGTPSARAVGGPVGDGHPSDASGRSFCGEGARESGEEESRVREGRKVERDGGVD